MSKKKLNREQREAVEHGEGPLLIIAGAGTGKTTVVTERIKYLITSGLAKAGEILALTFTEKAAREMQERVDIAMPYGYTEMWISTFHSFGDRVLRAEALQIGLDPRFKLMTQAEATQLVRENLFEFDLTYFRPLGNPTKFVGGMLGHFSRLQDEDIVPKEYWEWVKKQNGKGGDGEKLEREKWRELAGAYQKYDELKTQKGCMDFGDLIMKTLVLLRKRPNVLKEYRERFKFILVDEFQDTNYAQNQLAMMLAGKGANITVTGDDDQSIYRFRGAAVSNMIQFRKQYPKSKMVVLTKNYRSSQEILDRAYELIQHNNPDRLEAVEKIDKKLVGQRKVEEEKIVFIHEGRVENEAERVAREIEKLVEEYDHKDVAILVRANSHAEPLMRAMSRRGIPYQFLGPGRLFRQSEVVDLISYLKVLYDPDDSVSFYRLLLIEELGIEGRDLVRLSNVGRRRNKSLFEICEEMEGVVVSEKTREKIGKMVGVIQRHLKKVRRETAGQLLFWFLEEMDLLKKMVDPKSVEAEKRAANVAKFFNKLKTYETDHEDATVPRVVDWIELASELGESPLVADVDWTQVNAVNILTVHSSKGLEFPVVFLVNLVAQRFPTIERAEQIPIAEELIKEELPKGDFHIQEERRLFYVGMTRAKDKLYLTAANYYGEGKREKRLSPFIFEALGDEAVGAEQVEKRKQLSFSDYKTEAVASDSEGKQMGGRVHIDYLSYSAIETFRTCPLHYKLKYILGMPTMPSAALSMGISVHEALKDFYLMMKMGKRGREKLMVRALEENWRVEGYRSKSHERKAFEKAKKYLREYLKREFDPKKMPLVLEKPFVVPLQLGGQAPRPLKIGGKMDRVDELAGGKIEIIDYKTGANVLTQKQVDHNLQLSLYALAACSIKEEPFGKKPEEVVLTLYYFENQKKITTRRTKEDLEKAVEEIYEVRKEIEKSDFKCSGGYLCRGCEFRMFCGVDE